MRITQTSPLKKLVSVKKRKKFVFCWINSLITSQAFNVCNMFQELDDVLEFIINPKINILLGQEPPGGVLLYGPSGCGKTLVARAIAGELKLPMIELIATELVVGVSGDSESNIRDVFDHAIVSSSPALSRNCCVPLKQTCFNLVFRSLLLAFSSSIKSTRLLRNERTSRKRWKIESYCS